MARDAYVIREKGTVIFWSRKAGNTSLAEWLVQGGFSGDDGKRRKEKKAARRLLKFSGDFQISPAEALELIRRERFEDFILARNPFRRAVSAYVEKFVYYGNRSLDSFEQLKKFAGRAFLEAMEMVGKPGQAGAYDLQYPGLSFSQFLQYIVAKMRERPKHGEPDLNGHWNTQVPFSFDGRFNYKNIIKLERVAEEIQPLAQKLDCVLPFPHSRSNSVPAKRENDTDLSETPSVELIKMGVVPGPGALLNSNTRKLIQEAYEVDFRLLGYDPEEADKALKPQLS